MSNPKNRVSNSELHLPAGPRELGINWRKSATLADDHAFSSLWVMDRFLQIGQADSGFLGPAQDEMDKMLEGHS